MPLYEYECSVCGDRFERRQAFSDDPVTECPQCNGKVRRLLSRGTAFVVEGARENPAPRGSCSLKQTGQTCCGRANRCGDSPCGSKE